MKRLVIPMAMGTQKPDSLNPWSTVYRNGRASTLTCR